MDERSREEQLERLYSENAALIERLQRLEKETERLKNEVRELRNRPSHAVERIEYRFDQLKIERQEGTLHIGILPGEKNEGEPAWPPGDAQIPEPTDVPAPPGPPDAPPSPETPAPQLSPPSPAADSPFLRIRAEVHRYVNDEAPSLLLRLCEGSGYNPESEELDRIVADLLAQVDARIALYMKQSEYDPIREPDAFFEFVARQTIRDVEAGIRNFAAGKASPPPA